MPVAPLSEQLCFSLYAASMAVTRAYKPMLDEMGITYPQYLVLHALWEEDGRTIGAIAGRLALDSSTVTPLVRRMEAAGLLARARDERDERQVRVTLSARGREMRETCACLGEALVRRAGIAPERLAALNAELTALRAALASGADSH